MSVCRCISLISLFNTLLVCVSAISSPMSKGREPVEKNSGALATKLSTARESDDWGVSGLSMSSTAGEVEREGELEGDCLGGQVDED